MSERNWKSDLDVFEEEANERLERFLESLDGPQFRIDIKDGDDYGLEATEGWSFVYTPRGGKLARAMINRLYKIGHKYFPDQHFSIRSSYYQEL